ncbi:MAG: hypothetical protein MHM6MM_000267 [Cercozoa sp. M6MM]
MAIAVVAATAAASSSQSPRIDQRVGVGATNSQPYDTVATLIPEGAEQVSRENYSNKPAATVPLQMPIPLVTSAVPPCSARASQYGGVGYSCGELLQYQYPGAPGAAWSNSTPVPVSAYRYQYQYTPASPVAVYSNGRNGLSAAGWGPSSSQPLYQLTAQPAQVQYSQYSYDVYRPSQLSVY